MATSDDATDSAERGFVRRAPGASGTEGRRCPASPRCYMNPSHAQLRTQIAQVTESRLNLCAYRNGLISIDEGSDGVRD